MAICIPDGIIWPDPSVLPPDPADPDDPTSEEVFAQLQVEIAVELAWTTMQTLSGYAISLCPVTVRPCKKSCTPASYYIAPVMQAGRPYAPFYPQVTDGVWTNVWCGHYGDCSCTEVREVVLPGTVGEVVSVVIDGIEVDPDAYRVDRGNRLVRQDGEGWPKCQDMNLPLGEEGTFSVTYYQGAVSDRLVQFAAGILANEWYQGILGNECRLPAGTVALARQGINIEISDDLFGEGLSGIPEVNAVIMRYNPYRMKMPPVVYNIDAKPARQTTWLGD